MKKLLLALAISTVATTTAYADTYLKLGVSQLNHDMVSVVDVSTRAYTTDGYTTSNGSVEAVAASAEDQAFSITIGNEFNENIATELRYHMGVSNSSEREQWLPSTGILAPDHFGGNFTFEEESRADIFVLLKSPSFFGVKPYLATGFTTASLNVNGTSFDNNGFVYGAGLEFDITKNLSLLVEYLKYPEADFSSVENTGWTEEKASEATIKEGQRALGQTSKFSNTWSGERASISLAYTF